VAYDPSGAIVAGATVRVLNPQTEAVRETVTDENRFYIVDSLLPASYNVVGSLSGFGELTVSAGRSSKSRSVTPAANRASRSHRLQKL
jgi:Carboxypeptidase regulatory-like domain